MSSTDHNIRRHFAVQLHTFGIIGIDLTQKRDVLTRPWLTCVIVVSMSLLITGVIHFSWVHLNELDELTEALTPILQGLLTLWKVYTFVVKRQHMMKLVHQLWELMAHDIDKEMSVVLKENDTITFHNKFYYISAMSTGMLAMIKPIIIDVFVYIQKGDWNFLVPLKATYFVDNTNPFMYCGIFLINSLFVHGVVHGAIAIDSLYSWFVHNIVVQLKMLKVKIAEINTNLERGATMQELESSLIDCTKYHQIILSLAEQFDILFRPIVLVEFTLNALQICVISYQLGQGVALLNVPYFCGFFLAVSVQLLIYSNGGERLQNESESIAESMYSTPWPELPIRCRKLIIFAMMRAQKSCKVTGIFFLVSFPQLLWLYRTAASYVTLLRSMDE